MGVYVYMLILKKLNFQHPVLEILDNHEYNEQRRKQEELNYKACSKSKYVKMVLWKKRKNINSKASVTHSAFKSLFRLQKACCFAY